SDAVVLNLDVEIRLAEDFLIPGAKAFGLVGLVVKDKVGKLRRRTSRQANKPVGVALEDLLVDARLVIEAFEKRERREPHQIAKPGRVARQERQMKGVFLAGDSASPPLGPLSRCDVRLEADDGKNSRGLGLPEELNSAIQVAVIRECDCWHAERPGALDQVG